MNPLFLDSQRFIIFSDRVAVGIGLTSTVANSSLRRASYATGARSRPPGRG
jgi:hypothetical protein